MKKNILIFLLGGIIFSTIAVVATTVITADQVNYDENTTVKDKIDDLYTKQSKFDTETVLLQARAWDNSSGASALLFLGNYRSKYTYYKITNLNNKDLYSCNLWRWANNQEVATEVNTEYRLSDAENIYINVVARNNAYGTCAATILFYNK